MGILDTEPMEFNVEFDQDSIDQFHKVFDTPKDITKKIVDIYNYMAEKKIGEMVLGFETGIKMIMKIDDSEWKDKPRIKIEDVI